MDRAQLLERIDDRWRAFTESYAGLPDATLLETGVVEGWSVKDVLGHVATWEQETLKALPLLMQSLRPPRYGGIDRFNASQVTLKSGLTLAQAEQQLQATHQRLLAYIATVPESWFAAETRFRHRLRLDTYAHYALHTQAILRWRGARAS